MSEILAYDYVAKTDYPLLVLILGKHGAGKRTLYESLKRIDDRFIGGAFEDVNERTDCNVCIGVPDVDTFDEIMQHNAVSHILWVDSGDRVEHTDDYMYPIECDPHRMVIVDNSRSLKEFEQEEVVYCHSMLNIIKTDEGK